MQSIDPLSSVWLQKLDLHRSKVHGFSFRTTNMPVHDDVMSNPLWDELRSHVRELAFLDGGSHDAFTLASGRTSRWFFDTKPVMMHPDAAQIVGRLINARASAIGADFVGGLELGAVPLAALVIATASKDSKLRGFMVRKEPKGRGGRKTKNPPGFEGYSMANGGNVLLLEDVTTTGGSAVKAIERIHNETNCKVIAVLSIVDREEGAQEMFEDLGIPFESLVLRSHITEM